ncbi:TonB-dependent receptor, partial [Bacteroidia bacterium]|nr:TonB-dependent receptor [Bacteroidia bacterium]
MNNFKSLCFFIGTIAFTNLFAQDVQISGYVVDITSGENIAKARVSVQGETVTASSYGFYSLSVPKGENNIFINATGFEPLSLLISVYKDTTLDLEMAPMASSMGQVEIVVKRKDNIRSLEVGNQQVSGATIKKIPAFLGEADVIKAIQLLPGVTTVGEGASGFNVRGGAIDQNLVLLDEAPVYNSAHLFGFFSVFNPDAVKEVELTKGGIPANYGGRLSSTLDVRTKDGNNKKFGVEGGVGTIFSRLLVEGPIKKNKASFVIAGRRSYIDVLAKPFLNSDLQNARFNFYDLTAKVNWKYNARNKFYISSYLGDDIFSDPRFFGVKYGNNTLTARWNHVFSRKLFSNFTYYYSRYRYDINFRNESTESEFSWKS